MLTSHKINIELIAIGLENRYVVLIREMQKRVKVILIPGNEIVVYRFNSGFQELVGEEAERYVQSLLESAYIIEHY